MKCWIFVAVIFLTSLARAADLAALKAELMKADQDFNALSAQGGPPAAFLSNISPDGVFLGLGPDLKGEAAVKAQYGSFPKEMSLHWAPLFADVAASGDLGYTVGSFELSRPGTQGGPPVVVTGRYVTIWKRQADGTWKFVLDGGNEDKPKKK
jgi:ketosteroid isomerase-like protein